MSSQNTIKKYHCNICDKIYASYKSIWFHNYKYHKEIGQKTISKKEIVIQKTTENENEELKKEIQQLKAIINILINKETIENKLQCKYCNKISSRIDNLKRHMKNCKSNNSK